MNEFRLEQSKGRHHTLTNEFSWAFCRGKNSVVIMELQWERQFNAHAHEILN